jgi:hypothetical protein
LGFSVVGGVGYGGPTPGGADTDNDGVEDAFDNCTLVANADQADTDHNGCGNACTEAITCDGDGDTTVSGTDYTLMLAQFEQPAPSVNSMDCDGDTVVSGTDYTVLLSEFENATGPSGITTAQCQPTTCQCTPQ